MKTTTIHDDFSRLIDRCKDKYKETKVYVDMLRIFKRYTAKRRKRVLDVKRKLYNSVCMDG